MDVHSWSRPDQIRVRHLDLVLKVDFDRRILDGSVALHFDRLSGDELVVDTRDLTIHSVENAEGFELGEADPILGAPLRIRVARSVDWVRVHYSTSPTASGLQWLDPLQTAGKRHPFLYTQSQAIHARSWIAAGYARRAGDIHGRHSDAVRFESGNGGGNGGRKRWGREAASVSHGPAHPQLPDRAGLGRPGLPLTGSALRRLCRTGAIGSRGARVRRHRGHDRSRRRDVRALPMGPLRSAGAASQLSFRRYGKPAPHLHHAHYSGRGQESRLSGGP